MACTDLITKPEFLVSHPEFSDASFDAVIDVKLDCLECDFCEETWNCSLKAGSDALLAHQMTIYKKTSTGGGGGGAITSKRMGPVAVSYGDTTSSDGGSLSETVPGREYMRLRDELGGTGLVPGMGLGACC